MSNVNLLFLAPPLTLQLVVNGLLVGAIFALSAYGMALVWGVMNIINITQGEFVILGGFITVVIAESGFHPLLGIVVAPIILYCLGWLIYKVVVRHVVDKDIFVSLLATFGISILLQQMMNQIFGADIRRAPHGLSTWSFFDGIVTIEQIKLVSAAVAVTVAITLVIFLKRSRLGQAIRATAQNARAARIMGINTERVYAATYSLNAAVCGAAGALVAMVWAIEPYLGLIFTIRSFMIVVTAGLGNLVGVVIAGTGLGALENMAGFILGTEFQIAFVFGLLIVILVARSAMLGRKRQYLK
ncbi:MAG: branched-chain amino acid ABC transporter permease [Proteobacteria bacterium]|nr:branched-chain amino acid ABC transporter permease [Pseudomonadota bacterium]